MTKRNDFFQNKKTDMLAFIGLMAGFGAVLSYIETLISFSFFVPGIKLGLANAATVIALYIYGMKAGFYVSLIRIMIIGLLFGSWFSILFSLAGAVFSYITMCLLKKTNLFTVLGVSTAGAVMHNTGQLMVAAFIIKTYGVIYYVPFLLISGIITGIIIGIVSGIIIKYINNINKRRKTYL